MIAKTIGNLTAATEVDATDKIEIEQSGASKSAVASLLWPLGSVIMTARSTAPDATWMICDGSAISRTTYAALFSAIGTTFGVGDNSTTFNIPDMRGASPAGVGTSTGYTENETYALGTKYNDQMHGHKHSITDPGHTHDLKNNSGGLATAAGGGSPGTQSGSSTTGISINTPTTDGTNGTPRVGSVTRGKRVGMNFLIKVK